MHIKGKDSQPEENTNISIEGTNLEKVKDFKYLGSIKSENGNCKADVKSRIGMAKQKMLQLNNIWKDRGMPKELKLKILRCLIWPVVKYGCEAWTLKKEEERMINAVEMWLYRRLLRVSWKDRRTNNSILEELSVQRKLLLDIQKRRLKYMGHAIRNTKTDLMATVLQGKVEAKRNRGRPPASYMSYTTEYSGLKLSEVVHQSRDRDVWRDVVAGCGAPTVEDGDGNR